MIRAPDPWVPQLARGGSRAVGAKKKKKEEGREARSRRAMNCGDAEIGIAIYPEHGTDAQSLLKNGKKGKGEK